MILRLFVGFICALLTCSQGQTVGCRPGLWQCDDGSCIPGTWKCDGDGDCLDGSDEMDCPGFLDCPPGQFPCVDSVGCVDTSARCDGTRQCPTGYDEENCTATEGCLESDWTCENKLCVPEELRCNGQNDCLDNSDEQDCTCGENSMRCPEGTCLPAEAKCDGKVDCSDGSDEPITCGRICAMYNGGCSHTCVDEPWGVLCGCPPGFNLAANGVICKDLDECSSPFSPCMHDCVNTIGSFLCRCSEGFKENGNATCQPTGNSTRLLTLQRTSLGLLHVDSQRFEVIQTLSSDPVAMTFDLTRGFYYWADMQGSIHQADGWTIRTLYTGEDGINSLACDWLNGNLYWSSQETQTISVGTPDGKSSTALLGKNISPLELVLVPVESSMFWLNVGPGDRVTLETSWMDGSEQGSLLVLTAQSAHGLTADVAARRLYWISDFKKSIETVKVDGTGRYSFTGLFSRRPALALAAFGGSFYWIDDKALWQAPQTQPTQRKFIWKAAVPVVYVYHELQQPQDASACIRSPCQLCLLTKANPMGFMCGCQNSRVLLLDGTCSYPKFVYATIASVNMLEFKGRESTETALFTTEDGILSFDLDWYRDWLYWANQTGHVQRTSLTQVQTEVIPTPLPVCLIKVDQRTGNLYWLSCDQAWLGVSAEDLPQKLHHTTKEIRDLYLNWPAEGILWLEEDRILTMSMMGGEPEELLRLRGVRGNVVLDVRANSLLWNSKSAGLTTMSLLGERRHVAGMRWNISGSVVAAVEPFLVTLSDDIMTLWDRRDGSPIQDMAVKGNVISVTAAFKDIGAVPSVPVCNAPSVLCPQTSLCLSPAQLCDGKQDCPDGSDEAACVTTCPSEDDFRCKDGRRCVASSLVCDGRAHCYDGSDEIECQTIAPVLPPARVLKCPRGSKLCDDGTACVSHNHVCDGETDCQDGSDEQGCGVTEVTLTSTSPNILPTLQTSPAAEPPAPTPPACVSPSVLCPQSSVCIYPSQFCNGKKDCPDGFDEKTCVKRCPSRSDFRCKDRRRCIAKNLLCDGRAHCYDGSDELNCPSVTAPTTSANVLTCRRGSKLCDDGTQCVSYGHVCDGEKDCRDGSDEQGCDAKEQSTPPTAAPSEQIAPASTQHHLLKSSGPLEDEKENTPILPKTYRTRQTSTPTDPPAPTPPPCFSPSVLCPQSSICISPNQLCNKIKDCPDGFDEQNCVRRCPSKSDFRCKDRRSCVSRNLVCDGRAHCYDGSDELDCQTVAPPTTVANVVKCRRGSQLCKDGTECISYSHICDGEEDCRDGSDEEGCDAIERTTLYSQQNVDVTLQTPLSPPASTQSPCVSPSALCPQSTICISQTQFCNGQKDCPDGFDEKNCVERCPSRSDFQCKDRRSCVSRNLVCDGRAHCYDGSDEINCATVAPPSTLAPVLKCRMGSKPCNDGTECVLHSHVCDGEMDCQDGSDEQGCDAKEQGTPPTAEPSKTPPASTQHDRLESSGPLEDRKGNTPQISLLTYHTRQTPTDPPAPTPPPCFSPSVLCPQSSICISPNQLCNKIKDCPDGFDEQNCVRRCPSKSDFRCKDRRSCVSRNLVCDGRAHCYDGSDELDCQTVAPPTTVANVVKCRRGSQLCKDGTECVSYSHICDGEEDCRDGSDEEGCEDKSENTPQTSTDTLPTHQTSTPTKPPTPPACLSPSVLCPQSSVCISQSQFCNGAKDCPDGFDEVNCVRRCPSRSDFRCKDRRSCVSKNLVCDGRAHCYDGSDELYCPTLAYPSTIANVLKCRRGSKPCKDGTECVAFSHVCDGEVDCGDGSDEEGCDDKELDMSSDVAAVSPVTAPPVSTLPACISPSVLCPRSSICISPSQFCNGQKDCPDGFDEKTCVKRCPSRSDFRCKDRRSCVSKNLVCDGRAHCFDSSDELDCPTVASASTPPNVLKCRRGSKLCDDGTACVPYSHVCDGEPDCADGSDEQGCDESEEGATTVPPNVNLTPQISAATKPPVSTPPPCISPSVLCPQSSICIAPSQLCNKIKDCPDGFDEKNCVKRCPSRSDFRCKDRLSCVPRNQVCDGRAHCQDGSDEMNCQTVAPAATSTSAALKCRFGSRLCRDGEECVLLSHVCDGEPDCQDGSDEVGCGAKEATSTAPPRTPSGYFPSPHASSAPPQSSGLQCRRGAKPCADGTECVLLIHLCDGENDCLDGSDEQGCPEICGEGEFQCAHGMMCVPQSQVCDGKAQCPDRSDELNCWEPSKSCEHRCPDSKRCIPKKFLCDGERDCLDGSDELDCEAFIPTAPEPRTSSPAPTCTAPSVFCPGSSLCISEKQLCDGQKDCPDGFDEDNCITECKDKSDFLCRDRRKCISNEQVCDGRSHCPDGSDEMQCQSEDTASHPSVNIFGVGSSPLKCRKGSKPCADGRACVLYSHLCDGDIDCQDGSDEKGCAFQCKAGEFQCSHGSKCIPGEQVCDGRNDCQDRSDELNCEKQTEGCRHLCDNGTRCVPETFLCDGEEDCADGSDEETCGAVICADGYYRCASGQCVFEALRCDGHADCFDRSDEVGCPKPPRCPTELQCPHSHECLQKEWLCDGEEDCKDGSDEKKCATPPAKCREFQWQCGDSSQCIPMSWRCDGKMDCENGVDENKCIKIKCPPHLYQCGSGECVNPSLVCNSVANCVDSSDEGVGCTQRNCSTPSPPRCEDTCVSTPNGPRCFCAAGFQLQSNRVSCVDVDECNETPLEVCKHLCLNSRGSYTCFCHLGFYLEPDNRSCKTKDEPLLLASVQSELLLVGVHSGTLSLLSSASRPVFALDYHWTRQRVYWLSPVYQSIRWADMKNSNNKGTLIKGVKSDFIAVDWVGNNLYWVDGLVGQILAVKLSDATLRPQDYTVVLGEDLEQPRALVLLPHRGLMLWSEIGSTPQIKRAGMDGSNKKVLVSQGLRWPVSLAFDLLDNRVYWADEKLRCIGSASLDGDDIKILQLAETPSPFSVGVFNDRVFWSDTKRRTIRSAEKNTGKDQKVLLKRPGQPFGLKLMHALSQPAVSNPCDQLRCSHLCLLVPTQRGSSTEPWTPAGVCRCPPGLLLSQDKTTCSIPVDTSFILFLSQTTVTLTYLRSIYRDGVGLKKLPNGRDLALPSGTEVSMLDISVHGSFMYMADAQGAVNVLTLSRSRSRQSLTPVGQIVKLQDDYVTALALDWVTSNLYWTSAGRPDLRVTSPYSYTTSLLQGSLKSTTSIAVHPPSGRLCYTAIGVTAGKNPAQVECADMDGRNREVLWKKTTAPGSLAFTREGTRVYWADSGEGTISAIGVDGSGYKLFQTGPGLLVSFTLTENILLWVTLSNDLTRLWFSDGLQPKQLWFETKTSITEIRAYSNNSQLGTNSCSKNNGDCLHLCLPHPKGRACKCGRGFSAVGDTSCAPLPACPSGETWCLDQSKCVANDKFCDGRVDCLDQSDEQNCPNTNAVVPKAGGRPQSSIKDSVPRKDSCDLKVCNGHGVCVREGKVTRCKCSSGYKGEFCQEEEKQSQVGVVLGVLCVVVALMVGAVVLAKRRAWASRNRSADKETLMSNIGLSEQDDSDSEDLESPVDTVNPPLPLKSLQPE